MVLTVKFKAGSLALFAILLLFACRNADKPAQKNANPAKKELTKVSLRQEWFPNANYAGELFAVYETDSINGLDLTLEAGSDNIDPIKLVLSGSNNFGVVSADRLFTSNEKGADLVALGVINYHTPTVFLTKKELNVTKPNDFINHSVGILTGTNTELVYQALMKKTKTPRNKIKEIEAPFDVATFISNAYQVRPAFIYDEPVSLDLKGISYNLIRPEEYGVNFMGTVYFTTKKYADENPQIIQNFINALAEGWKISLKNPEKAIQYLKTYDSKIDENREILSLKKGSEYFKGKNNQVLLFDEKDWIDMANELLNIGSISKLPIKMPCESKFIQKYHSQSN